MENKTDKIKTKLPIRMYVCLVLVALLLCSTTTFSKYVSSSTGEASAQISIFASDVKSFDVPLDGYEPGTEKRIAIEIMNYEMHGLDAVVCEVSQRYTITAELLTGRLPIQILWAEGDATDADSVTTTSESPIGEFRIKDYVGDGRASHTYTMIIKWDAADSDYKYADEIDVLRVTIAAEQID